MKTPLAVIAIAVCGSIAAHASQIVNVKALNSSGTSVTLNAGTYDVSVIGTKQGGEYNGWDYATANFGTPCATPAPNAWVDSFDITIGGITTSYVASGNPTSASALGALATYQSSILDANGAPPADGSPNLATFTLQSTGNVNFTAADYLFVDNWGGVSLDVTPAGCASPAPEPSTFGLIGLVLAGGMAAFRRKLSR